MTTTSSTSSTSAADILAGLNKTSSSSGSSSTNQVSETQSRFLTLLTAQLKNQDPLNPMDNAQMTSQLAQISTVDGIERLNTTLQALTSNAADTQTAQAAALVGQVVLVPGSSMKLATDTTSGTASAFGGIELASAADKVMVTIKDSNGLVVKTLDLGAQKAGDATFTWDGTSDSGATAADGTYSYTIAATQGSNKVTATALALGSVASVNRSGSDITLTIGSLGNFAVSDIRKIF
jgi:flagellar basal-body rod modification protein FlgD